VFGHPEGFNGAAAGWRRKPVETCVVGRSQRSFNGAAAGWRRKPETFIPEAQAVVMASMGPPLVGGGNHTLDSRTLSDLYCASMGPPLVGGGNNLIGVDPPGSLEPLQWGRRWLAAETDVDDLQPGFALELQWGRRWLAAETEQAPLSPEEELALQWGRRWLAAETVTVEVDQ